MGDMFGKGGDGSYPPPQQNSWQTGANDNNEMLMQLISVMSTMKTPEMPQVPQMPALPQLQSPVDYDWTEKLTQLASKSKADYALDRARKHGRADTIHTSPLLDEDDETDLL